MAAAVIFLTDLLYAQPVPPPQLNLILENFSELEGKFKSGRWNEALSLTKKISSAFDEILPELQRYIKADISNAFIPMMADLRRSIKEKDMESTELNYIKIQELFFAIMDNFQYKVPPVLSRIDKYISEAEVALNKKDFRRVVSEMDEVGDFFYKAEPLLKRKGADHKDVDEFKSIVREVRAAGETKKTKSARAGIKTLKKLLARFLKLFETPFDRGKKAKSTGRSDIQQRPQGR